MSLLHRLILRRTGLLPRCRVRIRKGIQVPAADGTMLLTDLYLGGAADGAPAILIRSPYGRGAILAALTAYPLASQGYNVVLQSCRGTGGSGGALDPHHHEQADGLATLAWIRRQPWYGGAIGTFGPSYLGYVQWAVSVSAGSELAAMAIQVTSADFAQMTYAGDSFALENALTWTRTNGVSRKPRFAALRMLLPGMRRRMAIQPEQWRTLPLAAMDTQVCGEPIGFWQDWLQHASPADPWWTPMDFRRSIGEVRRPITMVAGWYDIFTPFQLRDFAALQAAGNDARITIGPWRHTDMALAYAGLHDALDWFGQHLRGAVPATTRRPVRLFVVGAEEWREFDAWPPREVAVERWHLQPQRRFDPEPATESAPDPYVYDPADPTPSIGGPALMGEPFAVDNRPLESRADVLTFTSEPLSAPRDLIGEVAAELHVASTAPSADFFVRVCRVDPQGVSMNVCDGLQRVNFTAPGVPQRVRVRLWPTAHRISTGERLRIQVSSGAFPRWARNLGGTEPLAHATQLQAATQSLYHSPELPSAVLLPWLRAISS